MLISREETERGFGLVLVTENKRCKGKGMREEKATAGNVLSPSKLLDQAHAYDLYH